MWEFYFLLKMKLPHDVLTSATPGVLTGQIQPRLINTVKGMHKLQDGNPKGSELDTQQVT